MKIKLETLERCLGDMLVTHPIRHLSQFVTWSRSQAFSIDGYVMSGNYTPKRRNFKQTSTFVLLVMSRLYNFFSMSYYMSHVQSPTVNQSLF